MRKKKDSKLLDQLLIKYLHVPEDQDLDDSTQVAELAADWRVVDLGIAVETEFGVPMSADKALSLKTVGDWRALVRAGSTD